ncbi:MAG: helix-turn-helix transcriptional regulator [Spirochaetia bacterium]|jgi:DNA-binding XRE family transcriptional regulator
MLAVVKTPLIRIHIRGQIPKQIVTVLKKEYGDKLKLTEEDDDELVDIFQTDWYTRVQKGLTPGKNLKIYRQNMHMTQAQLGAKIGNVPKQFISNMENGIRPISKKTAIRLAKVFKVSVAKFIG